MWYAIIISFIVVGVFFGSRVILTNTESKTNKNIVIKSPLNPNDTIKSMFSKEQLTKKLKNLAETPPPSKLSYGAMCYSVAYIKNMVHEYICPVCGQKTIYQRNKDEAKFQEVDMMLSHNLYTCRTEVAGIKGINIKLDETELCKHCSPNIKHPKLYLLINIEGQADTIRTAAFSYMDIRALNEFLNDKLIHKGSHDDERPLVEYSGKIKELLGIK